METTPILDLHPPADDLEAQVLRGLRQEQASLPCKLFYDDAGSKLFERITRLLEYYPTRAEVEILESCRGEISRHVGGDVTLIEYGSGSTRKIELMLDGLGVSAYVPIDISRWYLESAAKRLEDRHPGLRVRPVLADYSQDVPLPTGLPTGPRVGFFPGGTLGNFARPQAVSFLNRVAKTLGPGGFLVIGVDLQKDPVVIHDAYNDSAGVTAAFNLNLLARLNRELGGDFELDGWRHYAPYLPAEGRVAMHLVSVEDQRATVAGESFDFPRGRAIHTESSHKYRPEGVAELAREGGFGRAGYWTDEGGLFSVHLLRVGG